VKWLCFDAQLHIVWCCSTSGFEVEKSKGGKPFYSFKTLSKTFKPFEASPAHSYQGLASFFIRAMSRFHPRYVLALSAICLNSIRAMSQNHPRYVFWGIHDMSHLNCQKCHTDYPRYVLSRSLSFKNPQYPRYVSLSEKDYPRYV